MPRNYSRECKALTAPDEPPRLSLEGIGMDSKSSKPRPTEFAARLSPEGRLVIPKQIRERHGWAAGVELVFEDLGDRVVLREAEMTEELPETSLEDLIGCSGYAGPAKTLEDMEEGIARGARRSR